MDDLDVIRLAAMDIISIKRIARGGDGSEGEIPRWVADEPTAPPDPSTGYPPVPGDSFREKHLSPERDAERQECG